WHVRGAFLADALAGDAVCRGDRRWRDCWPMDYGPQRGVLAVLSAHRCRSGRGSRDYQPAVHWGLGRVHRGSLGHGGYLAGAVSAAAAFVGAEHSAGTYAAG